jgi:hypothetical protein
MKTFLFILFTCFCSVAANSQIAKSVVVEHFTNSRCSSCAGQNPAFNNNLAANPGVMRISYHPTAPFSNCIFAQHNPSENDARTNFYGLYGSTPRLAVNGSPLSNNPNPFQNPNLYVPYANQTSPFRLKVEQEKESDTLRIRCVLTSLTEPVSGSLRLFAAVAEDTVFYNSPNGENRHYNVFRKTFFGSDGITFIAPLEGDSLVWEGKMGRNQVWNFSRIFAYAIVQNVSDRVLQQSDFTKPADQTITKIKNSIPQPEFQIFPNPGTGQYKIRLKEMVQLKAVLLDAQGRQVYVISPSITSEADFSVHKPGIYFLKLDLNGRQTTKKVVQL